MKTISISDVRAIVRLLGEVAVLESDLRGKRRYIMQGLVKLLKADVWAWVHLKDRPGEDPPPMGFMFLEGGWANDTQRMKFIEATITDVAEPFNRAMRKGSDVHRTRRLADLFPNKTWFATEMYRNYFGPVNLGDLLSTLYPLGDNVFSSIVFVRFANRKPFSRREVCIAHVVTEEIDWLHREGTDVPAVGHVHELSLRQRQILLQVLSGDSVKQIAGKLSLSIHTVNDHMKSIYHRFGVSARGELLAQFLSGGAPGADTLGAQSQQTHPISKYRGN